MKDSKIKEGNVINENELIDCAHIAFETKQGSCEQVEAETEIKKVWQSIIDDAKENGELKQEITIKTINNKNIEGVEIDSLDDIDKWLTSRPGSVAFENLLKSINLYYSLHHIKKDLWNIDGSVEKFNKLTNGYRFFASLDYETGTWIVHCKCREAFCKETKNAFRFYVFESKEEAEKVLTELGKKYKLCQNCFRLV